MHTYTYKYARTTYMRVVHKHTHVHMPVNGDTYSTSSIMCIQTNTCSKMSDHKYMCTLERC